ncbi:MAG TPA: hypothetical protein VHO71_04950 [Caproiciproducens sp.]|nr:hypothetical protein [Caproiciproducens sp.]
MAYADSASYKSTFKGTSIPDGELDVLLVAASDDIDAMTYNRIGGDTGLPRLTEFQQGKIKRAACLQAEFRHDYADLLNNPLSSYGINGVSMQWDKSVLVQQGGTFTTNSVLSLLRQTGLTYRGVIR